VLLSLGTLWFSVLFEPQRPLLHQGSGNLPSVSTVCLSMSVLLLKNESKKEPRTDLEDRVSQRLDVRLETCAPLETRLW
jgi:hypothetical protein